jgi:hypothetical protein
MATECNKFKIMFPFFVRVLKTEKEAAINYLNGVELVHNDKANIKDISLYATNDVFYYTDEKNFRLIYLTTYDGLKKYYPESSFHDSFYDYINSNDYVETLKSE